MMRIDQNTKRLFTRYRYTLSDAEKKILDKLVHDDSDESIQKLARKLDRDTTYIEKKALGAVRRLEFTGRMMQKCKSV